MLSPNLSGLFLAIYFVHTCVAQYDVPPAKLEDIYPKGLRVSIPVYVNEAGEPVNPDDVRSVTAATLTLSPTPAPVTPADRPCQVSRSRVQLPEFICSGQLLFEENFLDPLAIGNLWEPEVRFSGEPDYPFVVYMYDNHISVRDGHLSIRPVLLEHKFGESFTRKPLDLGSRCTGEVGTAQCYRSAHGAHILPPIISGKITTKNEFNFRYGRVEIRAKLPKGDWLVPEIQLEPRDNNYGTLKYASGLMKVASVEGNGILSRTLTGGVIMSDREPFRSYAMLENRGQDSWTKDFHNYTLVWKPDGISLFVDGVNYANVDPGDGFTKIGLENNVTAASQWAQGSLMAPFDEMFYISLGISVGGLNDFSDSTPKKPWHKKSRNSLLVFWNDRSNWYPTWHNEEAELQVEYVRVYAF
uniref:Beta-1,3-glucan recognition protein 4b n=1 Tax=Thitarodes pui TaxID=507567 RepID=G3MVG4_THIPU|nr:beta-1,3-glucan recognition protein 4b [Thitarodes pui]